MADEPLPKPDGVLPGAPGAKPIPSYPPEVIYAGAPSPLPRSDAIMAGNPTPAVSLPPRPESAPPKGDVAALRSEINLFVCWLAGVFLILACGWGLIGLSCYLDRRLHLRIPIEIAGAIGAVGSLLLIFALERNLWLSRFMGLRLGPHSTQVTETLFFFFTGVVGLLLRSSDNPVPATKTGPENDGTREIVETVVFVVVLVLLLKTFLVEAFVIPTGSMADTLLGYHKDFTCEKCKYRFVVNCSTEAEPPPGHDPELIIGGECPNCGFENVNPNVIPRR